MKSTLNILVFSALTVLAISCSTQSKPEPVPEPVEMNMGKGIFRLPSKPVFSITGFEAQDSVRLSEYLKRKLNLHAGVLPAEGDSRNADIKLEYVNIPGIPSPEGYYIKIDKNGISVQSPSAAGVFNGINTLLQVMTVENEKAVFPVLTVYDHPRFSWRGMHLDVSRHFFSKEEVKRYLDLLALHKINVFHWHLTDDQGWRIEIPGYPELTQTGAYRVAGKDVPWSYEQELSFDQSKDLYGGFYSISDIREIIEYANDLYITIVPEIEMPGHSQAALTAYPHLSCSGKPYVKNPDVPFEFTHPFCAGKDETFTFLKAVLTEVMGLFPSEYIHIGGDEANHSPWEDCPACRKRMRENKLSNTSELQAWFITEIDSFLRENGRKSIGWDEIMEGDLTRDAAIMSWRHKDQTLRALRSGYKTVSATSEYVYLSSMQDQPDNKPSRVLDLEKVYSFEPVSDSATAVEAQKLIGVNGCIWTENILNMKMLEEHLLPRLGALSAVAWQENSAKSWEKFKSGLIAYLEFLDREKAQYYVETPKGLQDDLFFQGSYEIRMIAPYPGTEIRYTLDGTDPQPGSLLYTGPFYIDQTTLIKAASFLPSGKSSPVRLAKIEKTSLKEPVGLIEGENGIRLRWSNAGLVTLDSIHTIKSWKEVPSEGFTIPDFLVGKDHFVLVFEGFFEAAKDSVYRFKLSSDDGSRLWIGDQLLIDHDGIHGMSVVEGAIGLKKGYHPIRLEYFEAKYGEGLEFSY